MYAKAGAAADAAGDGDFQDTSEPDEEGAAGDEEVVEADYEIVEEDT
jgi:hypothetical protein